MATRTELEQSLERRKARDARERREREEFMSNLWEGAGVLGGAGISGAFGPQGLAIIPDTLFGFLPTDLLFGGVSLGVGFAFDGTFFDVLRGSGFYWVGRFVEGLIAQGVQQVASP